MNGSRDVQWPPRPTALAQQLLAEVLQEGDLVIDATAGNGHDTEFLAARVGATGRVLAFDVQAAAIGAARARVETAGWRERVVFYEESHARLAFRAEPGSVAVVMFNLGYLPGHDHQRTTCAESTLEGLAGAVGVLKPGGVLTVVCYPGHPEGAREVEAVEAWLAGLTESGWRVARYGAIGTRRPAPFLLLGWAPGG
ncbi:MAG: methyltransferase domain-containing protein [Akkermansiaceae bacterium]|nr:methyltransferase domain-containing protein [Akkermansiaceae bacterium]MCF7730433.1 methyltransferase domain-containing protein [Akkermansiaceae bacterium]